MLSARSRLFAAGLGFLLGTGCAGDPGADRGLPACNARPVDPPDYESVATERVEASDHLGTRYEYRGPAGEEVTFFYGVATDAPQGLPQVGQLALASVGGGRLLGRGGEWAFTWNDQFPCDPMTVYGTGFTKKTFTQVLSFARVTAFEEEEGESAPGEGIEGVPGEVEEPEDEISEGLPPAGGPVSEFVAVFDSARDPGDLDPSTEELMEIAPNNIAVAPASCWKGLPQSLAVSRNHYVAAVVATTGNELDFVIERVDRVPIFYGQLKARCID